MQVMGLNMDLFCTSSSYEFVTDFVSRITHGLGYCPFVPALRQTASVQLELNYQLPESTTQ